MTDETPLQKLVREKQERDAATQPAPVTIEREPHFDTGGIDLYPDLPGYKKDPAVEARDNAVHSLGVWEAYQMFSGKSTELKSAGGGNYLVSCPNPAHPDRNPSCALDVKKNVWVCYSCDLKGDVLELIAVAQGDTNHQYREKSNFPGFMDRVGSRLGFTIEVTSSGKHYTIPESLAALAPPPPPPPVTIAAAAAPAPASTPGLDVMLDKLKAKKEAAPPKPVTVPVETPKPSLAALPTPEPTGTAPVPMPEPPPPPLAIVHEISSAPSYVGEEWDEDRDFEYPTLDWKSITPEGSFLAEYMAATCDISCPEEYNFFNGIVAIGAALGRDTVIKDRPSVMANLYVCTVGPSGGGKSKSMSPLDALLRKALPWDPEAPSPKGIALLPQQASGESFIHSFTRFIPDPADPKKTTGPWPVKGLLHYDEFGYLISKGNAVASTMQSTLISAYDGKNLSNSSRTGGILEAQDPFCSITTTTQLKKVKELLSDSDLYSGFVNRWIFVMGPGKPAGLLNTTEWDLSAAVDSLQKLKFWASHTSTIGFTPDGLAAAVEYHNSVLIPIQEADTEDLLVRATLLFKKILLVLSSNKHEKEVTRRTVGEAETVMAYLFQTFAAIGARIGRTKVTENQQKVLQTIEKWEMSKGTLPSARDLHRSLHRTIPDLNDLQRTLEVLKNLDLISYIEPDTSVSGKGRPVRRFRCVGA